MKKASILAVVFLLSLIWLILPIEVFAQPTFIQNSNLLPRWSQYRNYAPEYQGRPTDIVVGGNPVAYQDLPSVVNLIVDPDAADEWYILSPPWPPDVTDFTEQNLIDIQSGTYHCSPTATAMVLQYWSKARGFVASGKPDEYPVHNYIFDISWHLDTNDLNPNIRTGDGKGHFATFNVRVAPGIESYVRVRTNLYPASARYDVWNKAVYENEIRSNRPVLIHGSGAHMGHTVVGIGFEANNMYIVDPAGGEGWEPYPTSYGMTFDSQRKDGFGSIVADGTFITTVFLGKAVGGIAIPVDKFGLLAPYIGLASTIIVATVATVIYVKRVKYLKKK